MYKHLSKFWFIVIASLFCLTAIGSGQIPDPNSLFDMSLEDLMKIPVVVSAGRSEQKITETSIATSTITAENIHNSGLTTIPEILQLAPGVDVRRLDRYRYLVGVRGLSGLYSDRTLVLINGRSAMNSVFGPPDWLNLPVMIEDIDRIEILRGPSGSAWGANALTGIINIITQKPGDDPGSFFSTTINEYGDTYNHLRFSGMQEKWAWRISAGYENFEDSDASGASGTEIVLPALPITTYADRDFAHISRFDSEFSYAYNPDSKLLFGAAYSYAEAGDAEFVGYFPRRDNLTRTTRLFARYEHTYDETASAYLQWFGNYVDAHIPHLIDRYTSYENDLEGQFNFRFNDTHSLSLGGNLRWTRINPAEQTSGVLTFAGSSYDEYMAGLFAIDRLKLSEKLSVETQGRVDYYSETHIDWSLRSSVLYALDDHADHTLRASFARSFRTANAVIREGRVSSVMGLFQAVAPSESLDNEHTYALEAGYTGKLSDHWILQVNSYYQRISDPIGYINTMAGPAIISAAENLDKADTYGTECELTFKQNNIEVTGWYAYNKYQNGYPYQIIRAHAPAQHKAGLRTSLRMADHWNLNANYTYNSAITNMNGQFPSKASDKFHRLDLNISHPFNNSRGEIMFGVADVLNKTQSFNYDFSNLTSHETPGRTFFARLQLKF